MNSDLLKKRRMQLLNILVEKTNGRQDIKLELSGIAPTLDIEGFSDGSKFVDKDTRVYEGGSDLAYDYNILYEEDLIKITYLNYETDERGLPINLNPAIKVTPTGFEVVSDAGKSWLLKSIDKQPMTFLQIILTIIIALVTGLGGWIVGRYYTPITCNALKISTPSPQSNLATRPNNFYSFINDCF